MENNKLRAFISYSHLDDELSGGFIRDLVKSIQKEVSLLSGEKIEIFFDRNSIEWGDQWEQIILDKLGQTYFLIPILTPSFFKCQYCEKEVFHFFNMNFDYNFKPFHILPLYCIDSDIVEGKSTSINNVWENILRRINYVDIREYRFNDKKSISLKTDNLIAKSIVKKIKRIDNVKKEIESESEFESEYEYDLTGRFNPDVIEETYKKLTVKQKSICKLFYTDVSPNKLSVDEFYKKYGSYKGNMVIQTNSEFFYRLKDLNCSNLISLNHIGPRTTNVVGFKEVAKILSDKNLILT